MWLAYCCMILGKGARGKSESFTYYCCDALKLELRKRIIEAAQGKAKGFATLRARDCAIGICPQVEAAIRFYSQTKL